MGSEFRMLACLEGLQLYTNLYIWKTLENRGDSL